MLSQRGYWAIYLIMSISEQENWSIKKKGGSQNQALKKKKKTRKINPKKLQAMPLLERSTKEVRFQLGSHESRVHFRQARVRESVGEGRNSKFFNQFMEQMNGSQRTLSSALHGEYFFPKMAVLRGQEIMDVLADPHGPSTGQHKPRCFRNH